MSRSLTTASQYHSTSSWDRLTDSSEGLHTISFNPPAPFRLDPGTLSIQKTNGRTSHESKAEAGEQVARPSSLPVCRRDPVARRRHRLGPGHNGHPPLRGET